VGAGDKPLTPLEQAVEEAYKVFAVPTPISTGVCKHCCMNPEIERDFLKVSIREMPPDYVADWYFAALEDMTHDIAAYLLPKIFELISQGTWPNAVGEEITLQFLAEAGYPDDWLPDERRVVDAFLIALIDKTLAEETFHDGVGLDVLLCMASNANVELGPFLDHLYRADDLSLARAVIFDFYLIGGLNMDGNLVNAFWETASARHRATMQSWYRSPELTAKLERAFFAETDPIWQGKISDAIEMMRHQ